MPKLTSVAVSLKLPFLGDINGTWEPDEAEQRAAWEMYVELVTRVSLVELQPGEGLLHEALASLYTLFDSTRKILREYGPAVAHGMRNEIVASKQKNERYVPLTCRRDDGKRGRKQRKEQRIIDLVWQKAWFIGYWV